jgi:UDP-N-acetyl-D-mannosaminuronic acid dehydrogenase
MSSVCVHGLGYIGLPTAAMLANYGHTVYGYDVDDGIRDTLRDGEIHLDEPGLRAFVTQALESEQLQVTDEIVPAKYQIICVPTPFDEETKTADLTYIREAGEALAAELREGDTVILESTVPPGTSVDELQPILERSGLDAGSDFALVHCPETVLPGNIITELRENNRIMGGVNGVSTESAVRLYESFVSGDIRTSSDPTVAEFVKLIQNTYRDVNIGLANEIARLADDYGIDSREAIDLANEHPRVEILQPGPGVGGHCLPVDPWFLGADSDELDVIAAARGVNDSMPAFVIELLRRELGEFAGRKIAVLGVAYKGNVGDTRMSPGLQIARALGRAESTRVAADGGESDGPTVAITDPHVTDPTLDLRDIDAATAEADAVVVATDHDEYGALNPEPIYDRMAGDVLVDTKACLDAGTWQTAGFTVRWV